MLEGRHNVGHSLLLYVYTYSTYTSIHVCSSLFDEKMWQIFSVEYMYENCVYEKFLQQHPIKFLILKFLLAMQYHTICNVKRWREKTWTNLVMNSKKSSKVFSITHVPMLIYASKCQSFPPLLFCAICYIKCGKFQETNCCMAHSMRGGWVMNKSHQHLE